MGIASRRALKLPPPEMTTHTQRVGRVHVRSNEGYDVMLRIPCENTTESLGDTRH